MSISQAHQAAGVAVDRELREKDIGLALMVRGAKVEGNPCCKCGNTVRYVRRNACVECSLRRNEPLLLRSKVDRLLQKIDALPAEGRKLLLDGMGIS